MSRALTAIKNEPDLWSALVTATPELAVEQDTDSRRYYQDYPGFREWLLTELALNTPTRLLRNRLEQIRQDMEAEGVAVIWPSMSKRQLDNAKRDLAPEWQPLRHDLEGRIQQVGLLSKNRRLLAYQALAEQLNEEMWDERNERSGELYLIKEYRQVLHAIAEEMGDLGQGAADGAVEGLVEIARTMAEMLKVHGTAIQTTEATPDYYREVSDAEYTILDAAT